jgi:hypothetical protein
MKLNKQWINISTVALLFTLVISVYAYSHNKVNKGDELLKVEMNAFKTKNGWGYEIDVDGKPYIKQETIPAIAGNKTFINKEDAETTGNAVMKKLLKGTRPSLSSQEVMALGIHLTP